MLCPQCNVSVPTGIWSEIKIVDHHTWKYSIKHFYCVECSKYSIKFVGYTSNSSVAPPISVVMKNQMYFENFIMPENTSRNRIPKDVEEIYVRDYNEAVKLLSISPMASAAFSRRLLQHYIEKKHKIKELNLQLEIKILKQSEKYPEDLIKLFDNIRHYGKFAAHAITDNISGEIIEVDAGEADSLLDILEEMFEYDYARIARIKERTKKLQSKLLASKPNKNNNDK